MCTTRLLVLLALLVSVSACDKLGKKTDEGADAAAAAPSSAPAASAEPKGKSLDATDCNPGKSLDPLDKGKTIESDYFRYTLLDVREDDFDFLGKPQKVLLVKLAVENIGDKQDANLSVAEVALSRNKATPDPVKEKDLVYKTDFYYPRPKMCVDLAGDVKPGKIPPGTKVVGYYAYDAEGKPYESLWFSARNISADSVNKKGKEALFAVAGSFRIK